MVRYVLKCSLLPLSALWFCYEVAWIHWALRWEWVWNSLHSWIQLLVFRIHCLDARQEVLAHFLNATKFFYLFSEAVLLEVLSKATDSFAWFNRWFAMLDNLLELRVLIDFFLDCFFEVHDFVASYKRLESLLRSFFEEITVLGLLCWIVEAVNIKEIVFTLGLLSV